MSLNVKLDLVLEF